MDISLINTLLSIAMIIIGISARIFLRKLDIEEKGLKEHGTK